MNKLIKKLPLVFFIIILAGVIYSYSRFQYNDVYELTLNGRVENIRIDIKEAMHVTIANEEHVFGKYYWPKFHKYVELGDSIYKKPEEYNIILIKGKTKQRIICSYHNDSY